MVIVFYSTNVNGVDAAFVGDGSHFRWIETEAQLSDIVNGTGPAFNGKAVRVWNAPPAGPVADPMAFGTPANAATAAQLGLPFP